MAIEQEDKTSSIKEELQKLAKSGTIIAMTTGCLFGPVDLDVYSKGRDQQEIGIISAKDMLATTAQMKLSWLLANEEDPQKIKKLMQINLRGEISEKLKYSKDFVK